jgi:hypothetical protein
LLRGILGVLLPLFLASPVYSIFVSDLPNGRLIAVAATMAMLFGGVQGVRQLLQYKRRRAAIGQEIRDYEAALTRAVDFDANSG